ncbi:toprim domain-containing protein [Rhodohalobacter mucosus]|uniref:Toprim domain-containing protein n=1 Tax=Rhodohalobacter mucosus TaxID=2079485 RepID=A0A316TWY4_9BACT|nr:toprim domain-containing protein [Rhodohalobacter mucosus]PWN07092.1 hypothetical protein DDZ15_07440 [Rhodohalobacter mucosus]
MSNSIYTLLIVESPVMARLIQNVAPSSVFVLSTGGYCWKPEYDPDRNRLNAVANPDQAVFRKELKEQSKWAGNIVVATDTDPSGDFIAWSLSRFLKSSLLKRGKIRHISKAGIIQMLSETTELNASHLEERLKNRHMIRTLWHRASSLPEPDMAAVAAAFSGKLPYQTFADENGYTFKSTHAVYASPDEWFPVSPDPALDEFRNYRPLSTFDIIEYAVQHGVSDTYTEAEQLLFSLFQHRLHLCNESLISYPRTDANAFYSETWEGLHTRFLQTGADTVFKPGFLRETADPNIPHESVHPLRLDLTPDRVKGELDTKTGELYRLIYHYTLRSLSMPEPLDQPLTNDLMGDACFYTAEKRDKSETESLRPVCTVSDFGKRVNKLGFITPSVFGTRINEWIDKEYITVENRLVLPGRKVLPMMKRSEYYLQLLLELKSASRENLEPETVKRILTS